jgi:DNA-binding transcriptional LysR family regulator
MRTEQFEYVATIARVGSFRRAAEELHISQPALSATVRNLERELGVDILERGRSGAQVSEEGRELLPYIIDVIDALDRLRGAAGEQHLSSRVVRMGTTNAGTVPLLTTTIQAFRRLHPETQVEIVGAQQSDIHNGLREGSFDLGLTPYLDGDDVHPEFHSTVLIRGRAVVCISPESPLAALETIGVPELLSEPMILMRSGYLMHRYVHRLLRGQTPAVSYTTDGAEMGKLMVAEGLGAAVLPDFSVTGDPLAKGGAITWRPLRDQTEVHLVIQRRRSGTQPLAAQDLHRLFVEQAAALEGGGGALQEVGADGRPARGEGSVVPIQPLRRAT